MRLSYGGRVGEWAGTASTRVDQTLFAECHEADRLAAARCQREIARVRAGHASFLDGARMPLVGTVIGARPIEVDFGASGAARIEEGKRDRQRRIVLVRHAAQTPIGPLHATAPDA